MSDTNQSPDQQEVLVQWALLDPLVRKVVEDKLDLQDPRGKLALLVLMGGTAEMVPPDRMVQLEVLDRLGLLAPPEYRELRALLVRKEFRVV